MIDSKAETEVRDEIVLSSISYEFKRRILNRLDEDRIPHTSQRMIPDFL